MRFPVVRVHAAWLVLALPYVAFAAPPPNRPAPPPRTQPNRVVQPPPTRVVQPLTRSQSRSTPAPQGFNLNHDINVYHPPTTLPPPEPQGNGPGSKKQGPTSDLGRPLGTTSRPTVAPSIVRSITRPGNTIGRTVPTPGPGRAAPNFKRATFNTTARGPYQNHPRGPVVQNPRHWSGSWQWNRGVAWQPAQTYWGGGFWGAFALGALANAVLFGSIADYQDQLSYPSYQVLADSPGEQLLQNYGLQQTPCGPDNLVVIWGPDNSVICAYPNDTVGPGNYDLDPTTLSLVSESS